LNLQDFIKSQESENKQIDNLVTTDLLFIKFKIRMFEKKFNKLRSIKLNEHSTSHYFNDPNKEIQFKTFTLEYRSISSSIPAEKVVKIIIGKNGYKIMTIHKSVQIASEYVLFSNVQSISNIEKNHKKNNNDPGDYYFFHINCLTIEKPFEITTHTIGMFDNVEDVHKLVHNGYMSACINKDKIIGSITI
jgi:hypothetical protein